MVFVVAFAIAPMMTAVVAEMDVVAVVVGVATKTTADREAMLLTLGHHRS